jgi:hypothetical protein
MKHKKSVLMTLNHNYGYFSMVAGIAGNGKVFAKAAHRSFKFAESIQPLLQIQCYNIVAALR